MYKLKPLIALVLLLKMPLRTNTSINHKPAIFNKIPINQQNMIAEVNYFTWFFFQFMQ